MTDGTDRSVEPGRYGRSALLLLAGLIAVLPLLNGNLSTYGIPGLPVVYDTVALPRLVVALVALCAAAALWLLLPPAKKQARRHPVFLLLIVVAGLATVSAVASRDPLFSMLGQSERLEGVVTWWLYAGAAVLSAQVVRGKRDLRLLASALVAATAVLAVVGLLQFLGVDWVDRTFEPPGFDARRAFATFGNPNFLAGLLVLAGPLAAGLALAEDRPGHRMLWWAALAAIVSALLATFTRGAWIAGVAEGVVAVALLRRSGARMSRRDLVAIGVAAALLLAVAGISLASRGEVNIAERLAVGASTGERLLTLQAGAAAIAEKPLLGWGPDAFLAAFRQTRPDAYAARFGDISVINNAHSWPVQTAATLGVPAALLFVAALVWTLVATVRFARGRSDRSPDTVYAAVWIGCLGFVVHMLFNVAVLGATVPFFVLLGALLVPACPSATLSRRWAVVGGSCAVALTVCALVAGAFLLSADHAFVRSRLAYAGATEGDAVEDALQAARLNPTSVKYARGVAEARAKVYYDLIDAAGERARIDTALLAADRAFLAVERKHSSDYATLAWHAALVRDAAERGQDPREATRAQRIALRAAALDRHAAQVAGIAGTAEDPDAVLSARSVPRLP